MLKTGCFVSIFVDYKIFGENISSSIFKHFVSPILVNSPVEALFPKKFYQTPPIGTKVLDGKLHSGVDNFEAKLWYKLFLFGNSTNLRGFFPCIDYRLFELLNLWFPNLT